MALLIIEHSERTGSDRLGMRLRNDGHSLQVVRVHLGEKLPENLQEIDGIVTCGGPQPPDCDEPWVEPELALLKAADRKSTRLNSSHKPISYAVFCLKKTKEEE